MESLKEYITILVTATIFMSAIEIIIPDRPVKKYVKFILGLIFLAIMINPVISFLSNGEQKVLNSIKKYETEISQFSNENLKEETNSKLEETFKSNIEKNCLELLRKEFTDYDFEVSIESNYEFGNSEYVIDKISVFLSTNGVKNIEKVEINLNDTNNKVEYLDDENSKKIKHFLSEELNIDKSKIKIYNAN